MTIVLVISSLGPGGAERVITLLAEEWARRGQTVTLITLDDGSADHYTVPAGVTRVALDVLGPSTGKLDAVRRNLTRIKRLRQAVATATPQVVISFMDSTNVMTLLATKGLAVPVIVSERIDPRHYPIARGWDWLRRKLYPKASAVVVQTHGVAHWARQFVSTARVHVIPNPVMVPPADAPPPGDRFASHDALPGGMPPAAFIAAMGRLDRQKGFDLLLQAYAMIPLPRPGLVIIGEGHERQALEMLATELGLEGQVWLVGRMTNPAYLLRHASMFVLSSRFEGFPNALLEAMALGLPVISFDCPSGPADIIKHDNNGLLVPPQNPERLAHAMSRLMHNPELSQQLAAQAAKISLQFSLQHVTDEWDAVIDRVQK